MSAELARLARRYRLEPLAYILEMARLEAEQIARESVDGAEVRAIRQGQLQMISARRLPIRASNARLG